MASDVQILQLNNRRWQQRTTNIQQICGQREILTGCIILLFPTSPNLPTQDQEALSHAFGIAPSTCSPQYQDATGYCYADESKTSNGDTESYKTALRFLIKNVTADKPKSSELKESVDYKWTHIGLWTQWRPSHSSVLICSIQDFGRLGIWDEICQALLDSNDTVLLNTDQPFDLLAFVLPHITKAFDTAVWSCRHRIRYLEQNRPVKDGSTARPHYESMHEVARHAIHITETLAMSITVLDSMMQEVQGFERDGQARVSDKQPVDCVKITRVIRCQKTLLECSHKRAEALTARLQNEINLAFHLGAERDSAIATQMARAMQKDSTAMKTISVLGLVFLPGTFVSSIFGMSFFSFTSSKLSEWRVAEEFWVYWVVTVPLTLLTIIVWRIWFRRDVR